MHAQTNGQPVYTYFHGTTMFAATIALIVALAAACWSARAEAADAVPVAPSSIQVVDPFGPVETETDPFETVESDTPVDAASYVPKRPRWDAAQANFEAPAVSGQAPVASDPATAPGGALQQPMPITSPVLAPIAGPPAASPLVKTTPSAVAAIKYPCAAALFKPISQIGIGIAQPDGKSPTDFATDCWNQINAGPNGACRCWPIVCYNWDATCLCYRPLYFEEINAERYGYVCDNCCCCCCPGNCMQSAASAAHFFGTIPCLPYCLAAECPGDCTYTLGHYRPGSCGTPWRWHWPPCDPIAALTTGGIYTGLVFAIP